MSCGSTPALPVTWLALFASKARNRETIGCNYCVFEMPVPFIDEALALGVKQFSFTGGEPFINKDIIRILDYALQHRPCLVLTNATEPLIRRLRQLEPLRNRRIR